MYNREMNTILRTLVILGLIFGLSSQVSASGIGLIQNEVQSIVVVDEYGFGQMLTTLLNLLERLEVALGQNADTTEVANALLSIDKLIGDEF